MLISSPLKDFRQTYEYKRQGLHEDKLTLQGLYADSNSVYKDPCWRSKDSKKVSLLRERTPGFGCMASFSEECPMRIY